MINFKELEKFVTSGKVMTLVVMIDGKEIGALSFTLDTLAYKAIFETAKPPEPVLIADKKPEEPSKTKTPKKAEPKPISKPEPEPLDEDDEEPEEEPEEEDDNNTLQSPSEESKRLLAQAEALAAKKNGQAEADKPFTRESILSEEKVVESAEVRANEHSGSKSAEEDGQPDSANKLETSLFKDEW